MEREGPARSRGEVPLPVVDQGERGEVTLELRHVSKAFAGTLALDDVSLELMPGRVTALLGANGSGKSTLIKILAGYHVPERGAEIRVRGRVLPAGAPQASHDLGLRFIHQDLGLVDPLSVAENMGLVGGSRRGFGWISHRRERGAVRGLLGNYKLDIDPGQPVASLSASQRSMIAIVRAIEDGLERGGVLVLDEPTASLPVDEVEQLMDLVRELRDRGVAILYVSHRLPEVLSIADDLCVLRDGKLVATRPLWGVTHDQLVELILGRTLETVEVSRGARRGSGKPLLEFSEIRGGTVRGIDIGVGAGEILGLSGVIGSGYESVLGLAFGSRVRTGGEVRLDGVVVVPEPALAIAAGIGYVPPERRLGVMPSWTVRENLTLPKVRATGAAGWMTARGERAEARQWVDRLAVKPRDTETAFMNLSGGNQQKVVIARWLRCGARAFLIDEPTLGVDAGAKRAIHDELRAAAGSGAAVVVASSDLEELCELCDRVLVIGGGRVVTELDAELDPDQLFAETISAANVR